jgi:hypothetical protein
MKYPKFLIKLFGKGKLPPGLDWYYDSTDVLENLSTPSVWLSVWLLGELDESAPNLLTIPALRDLRARGKPVELNVFPGADHGMLVFREEDGQRVYTGYAKGYWPAGVEAARRLSGLQWKPRRDQTSFLSEPRSRFQPTPGIMKGRPKRTGPSTGGTISLGQSYRALIAPHVVGWTGTVAAGTRWMRTGWLICGIHGPPSTDSSVNTSKKLSI